MARKVVASVRKRNWIQYHCRHTDKCELTPGFIVVIQREQKEWKCSGARAQPPPPPEDGGVLTFSSSALREKVMLAVLSKGALGESTRAVKGGTQAAAKTRLLPWPHTQPLTKTNLQPKSMLAAHPGHLCTYMEQWGPTLCRLGPRTGRSERAMWSRTAALPPAWGGNANSGTR